MARAQGEEPNGDIRRIVIRGHEAVVIGCRQHWSNELNPARHRWLPVLPCTIIKGMIQSAARIESSASLAEGSCHTHRDGVARSRWSNSCASPHSSARQSGLDAGHGYVRVRVQSSARLCGAVICTSTTLHVSDCMRNQTFVY